MSKHHANGGHYYKSSLRKGLDKFDTHQWNTDSTKSHWVSFHNYITWIALDGHQKNRHFEPAIKMCPPCQNFNYVVKVETMTDDIFAIFQKVEFEVPPQFDLGIPQRSFDNGIGTKSTEAIVEHIKSFYKDVSKVALTKLKAKFQRDLDLLATHLMWTLPNLEDLKSEKTTSVSEKKLTQQNF
ncbi:Oidioi.mRNA.OKI2018_I69.PAR.g12095.t1.cds [Oikopleura dioica]|uniref:Carbohydrate sulfotransferase n=1 Tax=Oikopleura dioica TaxID=34765 RepID=A0ABN7RYM8_OIKDI|nr:Oidioi.mRNA.OKI2018_I69.PAR.g12095.t1.cds [Oikopleura dioica]